ncbi:serine/threonine-protein kinase [Kitasatospora sp. NPDC057015]|uniref:serine/threonine-protein kinase n=1 Tax=Kitasatospora sp. NPDC057015 TaxID=3346001 RepID=UPI00363A219D
MTTDRPGALLAPTFQPLSADDPREVGGYRVFARLGVGGMGRVYLSYTPGGRPVALKVVRPELAEDTEFRERFAQEVASARRIHGLYTAQVVDAGVEAATPWLATTYVAGPSLHEVVLRHGPLPQQTVLLLTAGIAEALQAIHAAGVVHRDLKPANVLIAADGPRVIDFGIARAADASALTAVGLRIGSPAFMAPEQALGRPTSPATDVFALGALAVHVATGTTPFGTVPQSALYRVVHEEPDLDRVPGELRALLRHCLAKDPEQRPTTAQVIEAAHHALGGQLRFAEDWLPQQISTEIHRRTELPTAPAAPPTVLDPAPAATADLPTVRVPRAAPAGQPEPHPYGRAGSKRPGARMALAATAALLAGAVGAYVLLDPGADDGEQTDAGARPPATGPSATAPASTGPATPTGGTPAAPPAAPPGYTAVYTGTELTSPDHSYEFDIKAGSLAPQDTAAWYVGRSATEFYVPEDSDAFIAPPGGRLDPADCLRGVESRPDAALPFTTLGPGRTFCVRAQGSRDLAVVRVLATSTGDGPVKVSVDFYRHDT